MRSRSSPSTSNCSPRRSQPDALRIRALLQQRGACFANDLQRITGLSRAADEHALWELATAGLAAADGFDQLRALMDPRRKPSNNDARRQAAQPHHRRPLVAAE